MISKVSSLLLCLTKQYSTVRNEEILKKKLIWQENLTFHISISLHWRLLLWEMIQQINVVLHVPLQMTVQTLPQCLVCALNAFQYLVSTENLLCLCETAEREASEVF